MAQERNLSINFDANVQQFNQKINQMQRKINNLSKSFQSAQKATKGMTNVDKRFKEQDKKIKKVNNTLDTHEKKIKKNTKAIKNQGSATNDATNASENWLSSYSETIGIAIRSTALWGAATTAIYGTKRALEETHQIIMDVNSEMVALERVMNDAITNFEEIESAAATLGIEYAENIDKVVEGMVQWGRQGKNQVEVIKLTEAALLATNVAQMETVEAVDLLTASILQFNMEASEATEVVDRLNEVANNYATTAQDLAMSIRESGAAAKNAGVSIDELIGTTTALQAATAKSGSRIGRALRTMFSRMLGDMQTSGEALGKVENMLNSVGIAVRESEEDYRGMTDVLTDLAVKWDDLDEVMQANIARAMGGRRRYSDVISVIENWDMALDATDSSMNSLNSAIEENEVYMDSMEAQWQQAKSQFESLALTANELGVKTLSTKLANALESVYRNMEYILTAFNEFDILLVSVIGTISWFTSTALAARGATISLIGALNVLSAHLVATTIVGVTTATIALTNAIGRNVKEQKRLEAQMEKINDLKERSNELSLEELNNVNDVIDGYQDLVTQYQNASEEFEEQENALVSLDRKLRNAIPEWLRPLSNMVDVQYDLFTGSEGLTEAFGDEQKAVDELRKSFPELSEEYENNEEFMERVTAQINEYRNEVENTVSWISKYTTQQIESTKQGIRETQMLDNQREKYHELANETDRTIEQEIEMREIMSELQNEFPKLGQATDDFGKSLDNITQNQMEEFGRNGEEVDETISLIEKDLGNLDKAEEELEGRQVSLSQEIVNLEEKLENLDPKKDAQEFNEVARALEKNRTEYTNVNERLVETVKLEKELKEALDELKNGADDFDATNFMSQFGEIQEIFEEFKKEIREIELELADLDDTLDRRLSLVELKNDLQDLGKIDSLENIQEAFTKTQDDVWGFIESLNEIEQSLDSNMTQNEVKKISENLLSEVENTEDLDIDVDFEAIQEDMDVEGIRELISKLEQQAISEFSSLERNIEDYDLKISVNELFDFEVDDVSDITDEEDLKEMRDKLQKTSRELFSKETFDGLQLTDYNISDFNELSEKINKALFEIEQKFDDLDKQEGLEKQVNQLKEIDSIFTQLVDREFYQEPILIEEPENTEEFKTNVQNLSNAIQNSFEKMESLDVENMGLSELENTQDTFENFPEILNYIEEKYEDIDLSNIIDEKDFSDKLDKMEAEIKSREIDEIISQESFDNVGDLQKELQDLEESKEKLRGLLSEDNISDNQSEEIMELIRNIDEEIDNVEFDIEYQDDLEGLKQIESTFNSIFNISDWERESFLTDNDRENLEIYRGNIEAVVSEVKNFDIGNLSSEDNLEQMLEDTESFSENVNEIINRYEWLDKQVPEIDLSEYITKGELSNIAEEVEQDIENIENEISKLEIEDEIDKISFEYSLENMGDLEQEIAESNKELEEQEKLLEQAKDKGASNIDELRQVIKYLKGDIEDLNKEQQNIRIFETMTDGNGIKGVVEDLKDFDMNEVLGISNANAELIEMQSQLERYNRIIKRYENQGLDDDFIQEQLEEMDLNIDEEEFKEKIEELEKYIEDTRDSWANAFSDGIQTALQNADEFDTFADKFELALRNVMGNVLEMEEGKQAFQSIANDFGNMIDDTFELNISSNIESGIMSSIESFSQGSSLGTTALSGIGTALGGAFGGAIGQGLGMAIESVLGGDEGVEEMEQAQELNDEIKETENNLKELGMEVDTEQAKIENTSDAVEKLFGKETWEVSNMEDAEKSLEEMEETLDRIDSFTEDVMSGLQDGIINSLGYWDFKRSFEETIGKALQDTIVEQIIYSSEIEKAIDELGVMAQGVIGDDGEINDLALKQFEEEVERVVGQSQELQEVWDEISDEIDVLDNPEVDARQSFSAGQSTTVHHYNTYTVDAGVFMGDESEARTFAKTVAPYIEEYLNRESGN
ncbi:MAG: phage tail tape measure protein [Bacillota bacterium]